MVKYHFITFASPDHMEYAINNVKTALDIGGFDFAKIYTIDDVDEHYKMKNSHILKYPRGAGYWVWKPYIVLKHLLTLEENDILCYNDSKYLWTTNIRNLEKDILINSNIGIYLNKPGDETYIEKKYTKMDAYILMDVTPNIRNSVMESKQAWSGFILLRKSFIPIRFIGEWLTYIQDIRIVSDSKSLFFPEEVPEFYENRHDQTILSLLAKKWGIPLHIFNSSYMIDIRQPYS
jgi:hypothetical protein